jgi:hypothetical protein
VDEDKLREAIAFQLHRKGGKIDKVDVACLVREEIRRYKYVKEFRKKVDARKPKVSVHPYYGDAMARKVNGGPIDSYDEEPF